MSRKIIGVTVGTTLPKPDFAQTDVSKGDYIKNKPDFEGLENTVSDIQQLVGDTPIIQQISQYIEESGHRIYKQNEEPVDAPDGSLWVDLDAVSSGGSSSSGFEVALDTTLAKAGYAADAKAVGDAIAEIRRYVDDTIIGGEW